jgi:hypothetical protein
MPEKIKNIKTTLKNNVTAFLILGFIILYFAGSYLNIKKQNDLEQKIIECSEFCIPEASMLIQKNINECWCYENNNTLIKKEK